MNKEHSFLLPHFCDILVGKNRFSLKYSVEISPNNSLQLVIHEPKLSLSLSKVHGGMASTSAARSSGGTAARIQTATTDLSSDNQSLVAEMRKAMITMKEIAVESERRNQTQMVKDIEDSLLELLVASEDCTHLSTAIESIGNNYQHKEELTDFKKLIDGEVSKFKASSSSAPRNYPLLRQFREAIWNVHHSGQPMPGEEQEDIVMTSTQYNLLNTKCPLTGKNITELVDPVRCMDCKHIYGEEAIKAYISSKNQQSKCPIAGCPKILVSGRIHRDPLLLIEIEELRMVNTESTRPRDVEDITGFDEDD